MTASTLQINLEIVAYLLIKDLDLFTSEVNYLVTKVSTKSGFILILCLFFRWHIFKDKKRWKAFQGFKLGVKVSHLIFYHADYMMISPAVACL